MAIRIIITRGELDALTTSGAMDFCKVEKTPGGWKLRVQAATFDGAENLARAHRALRVKEPEHKNVAIPFRTLRSKLAVALVLGEGER